MKKHARTAYNQLKKIGVPVFDFYNDGSPVESHFVIIGELAGSDNYIYPGSLNMNPDGNRWAEYYSEDRDEIYSRFGVHNDINDILEQHNLFSEWKDCASLNVWDI